MKFFKWLYTFIKKGIDDNITVYAAQSAYFLIISSIPFMMIILSVTKYFIPFDKADFMNIIPVIIPSNLYSLITELINEIFSKPTISLISISAATTLWSASRGFAAIERGIKVIYKIPKRKLFITDILVSFLYTIIFAVVLLLSLGVILFGSRILSFLDSNNPWLTIDMSMFQYSMLFLLLVLFFSILYETFSSRKISFVCQLPGALFTSLGWVLFSYLFSIYINNFANYSRIYGSLTAIILVILWLYFCMTILLYGAEINKELIYLKEKKTNDKKGQIK